MVNRNQDLLGKTFIVLRRHEERVTCLSRDEWLELWGEIDWATERIRVTFAPDHFNYSFLMNLDQHVHLHIIPRYVGRREFAGVIFEDEAYPDGYARPPGSGEVLTPVIAVVAPHSLAIPTLDRRRWPAVRPSIALYLWGTSFTDPITVHTLQTVMTC